MLEDLQAVRVLTLNDFPVVWLENSFETTSIGQVLHLEAPQGWLPGGSYGVDVRAA